ncbi:uncharacterized protein MONBRDRAFT_35949 [Monosiga brevicollis MX1]|uniref:Uncharacterized protein n=1 Tax=Monosiga brevicollis TaxID=81824 RepID=A9UST1_MONBE|nr:uncharacterized protein MONBRDRAFT_35949 [Monosiga brevicollis MX1]EDQ91833.1 predicted protein [Monosiga brevicollis MX1]|eukprot:XP_001743119.1 hypothetical protein [Monosiga brevicollis MX1]
MGMLRLYDTRTPGFTGLTLMAESNGPKLHAITFITQHPHRPEAIVAGTTTGLVLSWDMRHTQFPVSMAEAHEGEVWCGSFHPVYSNHFLSGGEDGGLLHWAMPNAADRSFALDTDTHGATVHSLLDSDTMGINCVAAAHNMVAAGTDNQALILLERNALVR